MIAILSLLLSLCLWPCSGLAQILVAAPVNRDAPSARGLVAWWRAVPGTTGGPRLYDLLGREPLVLANTTTRASTERPGGAGYAPFNGASAYGQTSVSPRFFPAEQTMMAWIKRTAAGGASQALLSAGNSIERQLSLTSSGALAYVFNYGGGYTNGTFTGPNLAVGPWYHVAMMHSVLTGFGAYVNCQVQQAFPPDGGTYPALTQSMLIGAGDNGTLDFFSGLMDDVRIYNRGIPQGELCQIMRESTRGEPTLLRAPLLALGLPATVAPSAPLGNFFRFFGQP